MGNPALPEWQPMGSATNTTPKPGRPPGSMASWNLDPERHVFNTATPDLDQHPPPFRMGAEMARGSESAFLICTPKQRLCRRIAP